MQLFKKPNLQPKDYLANLQAEIFAAEKRLDGLYDEYAGRTARLEEEYQANKIRIQSDIDARENILRFKRAERTELSKPFDSKMDILNEREKEIDAKALEVKEFEHSLLQRERDTENKLQSVQELCDRVGETNIKQLEKEKVLKLREKLLQEKETETLAGIEELAAQRNKVFAELIEKESIISLRELNIESKEENLIKREEKLLEEKLLIQSQRQALMAAKRNGNQ